MSNISSRKGGSWLTYAHMSISSRKGLLNGNLMAPKAARDFFPEPNRNSSTPNTNFKIPTLPMFISSSLVCSVFFFSYTILRFGWALISLLLLVWWRCIVVMVHSQFVAVIMGVLWYNNGGGKFFPSTSWRICVVLNLQIDNLYKTYGLTIHKFYTD